MTKQIQTVEHGGIMRVINRKDVGNIISSINMTLKDYGIRFELDDKENLKCVSDGVPDMLAQAQLVKQDMPAVLPKNQCTQCGAWVIDELMAEHNCPEGVKDFKSSDVCMWCGKEFGSHLYSRKASDPVPRVPCTLLKSGFILKQPKQENKKKTVFPEIIEGKDPDLIWRDGGMYVGVINRGDTIVMYTWDGIAESWITRNVFDRVDLFVKEF